MDFKKALLFLFIGFGIAITGTIVLAKHTTNAFPNGITPCQPAKTGIFDNFENNCDYIYGKLDYMDSELNRITSYLTNIHSDLEKHSGINTPLNPN